MNEPPGTATISDAHGRETIALHADRVGLTQDGQRILNAASLTVETGQLVALIGPSGSGKTTLLRTLAGVADPSEGRITLGGDPIERRGIEVGYLPYVDTVHDRLTVREELGFAATLRLPEASRADIIARVGEVIGELRLDERADHFIGSLSGGERRRAAVALELLARPAMLLLDEPGTGLDPVLERQLMRTLRAIADQGRGVLVTTHSMSSLTLCDAVAVMAPGGRLAFQGTPAAVLDHFGVTSYDEIYDELGTGVASHEEGIVAPQAARQRRVRVVGPFVPQATALGQRYFLTFGRDRRTLSLLLAQAPIMGLIIGFVLPRNVIDDGNLGDFYALLLVFLLLTASIWVGIISSCREVVKERDILAREVAAGVRLDSYLAAKLAILLPLTALQVAMLTAVVVVVQPLGESPGVHMQIFGMCVLASWAAVTLGLLMSALSRSVDQATSAVPLMLIPQLLLAGAIIPVAAMPPPVEALSALTFARWGLTGMGGAMGLGEELSRSLGSVTGFDADFFALGAGGSAAVLVAFCAITLVATAVALDRRAVR